MDLLYVIGLVKIRIRDVIVCPRTAVDALVIICMSCFALYRVSGRISISTPDMRPPCCSTDISPPSPLRTVEVLDSDSHIVRGGLRLNESAVVNHRGACCATTKFEIACRIDPQASCIDEACIQRVYEVVA